ncbi:MAG: hypothetical protein D6706_01640 [Chloroflexi bacterium]|nr:MAG: hypothetical protein D6706_01640 [Chloroflexota bacterium]
MERFYVFILRNDVWIYILCVMGLFWYGSQYLRARHILREAVFSLERETGTQLRNTSLILISMLLLIISGVYYVNTEIAPTLPRELLAPPTPTPNIFSTRLASPTPLGTPFAQASPTPVLAPTITLPGQAVNQPPAPNATGTIEPVGTPTPPPPTPTPFVGCNIVLNITEPGNGSVVSGNIAIFGTVNTVNFGTYRLEANGPETRGQWANLLGRDVDQAVTDGQLGMVNLSQWASGPYLIRLTAIDQDGNITGVCVIQVTLDNR